jgi:hypothetical protein
MNVTTYNNSTQFMNVTLLEVKSYSFDTGKEASIIDQASQTKVVIASDALMYANGTVCNASASMKFAYLNSSDATQQTSMPGGYQGYLPNGQFGIFESFGATYFEFADASGAPLYIR